jgi:hypothetical protein
MVLLTAPPALRAPRLRYNKLRSSGSKMWLLKHPEANAHARAFKLQPNRFAPAASMTVLNLWVLICAHFTNTQSMCVSHVITSVESVDVSPTGHRGLTTLYSVLCTLYSLLFTLYSLVCALYSVLFTLYSQTSNLYSLLSTPYRSQVCHSTENRLLTWSAARTSVQLDHGVPHLRLRGTV